jgi:hypothetical protein
MQNISVRLRHLCQLATMLLSLIIDAVRYLGLCLRPSPALAAENLFLRKPLVLYQERQAKPRQVTNAIRLVMVWLSRGAHLYFCRRQVATKCLMHEKGCT